jgi:multiple sugar transport system ATP-binding protein
MNRGVVQQLAAPEAVYDDPANLFVAGFIGSPSMNLVRGALGSGTFRGGDLAVGGFPAPDGAAVLGVRPEDVAVTAPGTGLVDAPVYSSELTGEAVLVTVTLAGRPFVARAPRHLRCAIGEPVGISFDPARAYLFDAATEARIRFNKESLS